MLTRVLRIILVILPEHQSDTFRIHNDDGNPSRVNLKQLCSRKRVTIRFTLILLSALRRSDNENKHVRYNIYIVKRSSRNQSLILAEFDSLPHAHAHAQTTKTYYKLQDSRIKKAQELKTKTSANSDIKDPSSKTKLQGRLLESFQEDAKYEHAGQDTRSQDGNDDKDKQGKDLKISELKDEVKR
ncbi:hypothetical protein Tco_0560608 [Tanacetum coccineum]